MSPRIRTETETTTTLHDPGTRLKKKIENRTAVIGIVGLGYVGLPLAVEYASRGYRTIGIDVNSETVIRLNEGICHIADVAEEAFSQAVESGTLTAEDSFDSATDVDIFFICVPTPVTPHKDPDVSYIRSAAEGIARRLRPGQLVILKSTTYPETTEGVVQPILEKAAEDRNMLLGRDYFLAFSPERIDPGNTKYTTANTPIVVGGVTNACTDVAAAAIQTVVSMVHRVSSPKVAEMEKLLENIFRSVNIALVNEMARLCDRMGGISIWEVVEAAATKPFGFMPFYPGPGLGGHCIPIDPYYLSWLARRYDFETNFITLSARTNEDMPFYVVDAIINALVAQGISREDSRILILGVAFKKNITDTRHSPAVKVMEWLAKKGFENITFCDPHVDRISVRLNGDSAEWQSVPLSEDVLKSHDVTVIMTDHDAFSYHMIAEHSNWVVDTRNALKDIPHDRHKVSLLGGGRF